MEDVLSLIRSLAEQLQDPPEIPYEGEVRDQEHVEREGQNWFASEQFVDNAEPTKEPVKPALPPNPELRQAQRALDPAAVVREPVFTPIAEVVKEPAKPALPPDAVLREIKSAAPPEVIQTDRYAIAPSEVVQPTREDPRGIQSYEPIQVAAAMATAQLNSPEGVKQVEVVDNTRLFSQQVTATTRVTHVIPEGFPIDAGHAFAAVDRDVTLPEVELEPTKIGPFRPAAVPPSTEKMVFDGYTANSTELDRHARLVF